MGFRRGGRTYFAWNNECDGLNGVHGELVCTHDLTLEGVDCTAWDETHPVLWVAQLVFIEHVQIVVLVLNTHGLHQQRGAGTKGHVRKGSGEVIVPMAESGIGANLCRSCGQILRVYHEGES